MSINDGRLQKELQIMKAIRDRIDGLETPGVRFFYRVADSWEMQQHARDAARKRT
jgi:hypothetical protein